MFVLGVTRNAQRHLRIIGRDADAIAGDGLSELTRTHNHWAFETAAIAQLPDARDVLLNREWKLHNECCESEDELHSEEFIERNVFVNPVGDPRMEYLVLVVARCF